MTAPTPPIEIRGEGIDSNALVQDIQIAVAAKMRSGAYSDPRIARAEKYNLQNLKNEEEFLTFYFDCLRSSVFVDINDFEIVERRARFSRPLVALKKGIWSLLKFYTYRLWSQQNMVNGLVLSAIESVDSHYRDRIRDLEERVKRLEAEKKA